MEDPWAWATRWGLTVGGAGESNGNKCGTTVTEQQFKNEHFTYFM